MAVNNLLQQAENKFQQDNKLMLKCKIVIFFDPYNYYC